MICNNNLPTFKVENLNSKSFLYMFQAFQGSYTCFSKFFQLATITRHLVINVQFPNIKSLNPKNFYTHYRSFRIGLLIFQQVFQLVFFISRYLTIIFQLLILKSKSFCLYMLRCFGEASTCFRFLLIVFLKSQPPELFFHFQT